MGGETAYPADERWMVDQGGRHWLWDRIELFARQIRYPF